MAYHSLMSRFFMAVPREELPPALTEAATPWLMIAVLFTLSRLLALGWMLIAQVVVPASGDYLDGYLPNPHPLLRWDGSWYLDIVQSGYWYQPGVQSSIAFFPAYPLLCMPLVSLGIPAEAALLIVSNLCALLAAFALWRLVADVYGREIADLSLLLFLCNPVMVFFMAGYTESTFVLFCILAMLLVRRRWPLALIAGAFAGVTRSTGLLLALPLLLEALWLGREQRGRAFRGNWRMLACAGPAIGLGMWCLYLQARFGDALASAHTQGAWRREFAMFWHVYGYWLPDGDFYDWFFSTAAGFCIVAVLMGIWLRLRPSWTLFSLLSMAVFMNAGRPDSTPRFVFGMFSIYPAMALIATRFPAARHWFLVVFIELALVSIALFTRGYWFI